MTSLRAGPAVPVLVPELYMFLPADWPFNIVTLHKEVKDARLRVYPTTRACSMATSGPNKPRLKSSR